MGAGSPIVRSGGKSVLALAFTLTVLLAGASTGRAEAEVAQIAESGEQAERADAAEAAEAPEAAEVAEAAEEVEAVGLEAALAGLASRDFREKSAAITAIADSGAPSVPRILEALLEARLSVRDADGRIVGV
ncbi:hypothetical protein K2X89_08730, partial [Myxococcota bacterium]|nr:hypothetical protein [Myxococcota bacterium]